MYVPICPMKASPVQPRFGVQLIPLSAQLEMKDSPPIVTWWLPYHRISQKQTRGYNIPKCNPRDVSVH